MPVATRETPVLTLGGKSIQAVQPELWSLLPMTDAAQLTALKEENRRPARPVRDYLHFIACAIAENPKAYGDPPYDLLLSARCYGLQSAWAAGVTNEAGTILGSVSLVPLRNGNLYLHSLGRLRVASGRALGRLLLRTALEAVADSSYTAVELDVAIENQKARHIYEGIGFTYEPARDEHGEVLEQVPEMTHMCLTDTQAIHMAIYQLCGPWTGPIGDEQSEVSL